jgi:hypothetical protein
MYHCEAKTVEEFIRRIRVDFVPHGYYFYVQGEIPEGKDPATTDAKIIRQYGIDISKWSRARRKRKGEARVQYVRWGRRFFIFASHGRHRFFECEAGCIRDWRQQPVLLPGRRPRVAPQMRIFSTTSTVTSSLVRS